MNELKTIFGDYNQSRFDEVNKEFLQQEFELVTKEMADGAEYYQKILQSVELDRNNLKNSYIMYLYDKVDKIDNSSPVSFIKAKNSLPDIDTDFPIESREMVISYLSSRYGKDYVAQVCTFGTMKASGALKEVLRITGACDHLTANKLTENIPDEAKIAAQLKDSKETSILMWTLKYQPVVFEGSVKLEENGEITGEFAEAFKKAVKLEGLIKSIGKHPAAVIIGDEPLEDVYPMIYDESSGKMFCGMEYTDLEAQGAAKMDILGVASLSKLQGVNNLLRYGRLNNEEESRVRNAF